MGGRGAVGRGGTPLTWCALTTGQDGAVVVTIHLMLPAGDSRASYTYTVHGGGSADIASLLAPKGSRMPVVPRMWPKNEVPGNWTRVEWDGCGLDVNYWDHQTSAAVGRHAKTVADMIDDCVEPQENGHRSDARRMALADAQRRGPRRRPAVIRVQRLTLLATGCGRSGPSVEKAGSRNFDRVLGRAAEGGRGDDSWGAWTQLAYNIQLGAVHEHRLWLEPIGL